MSSVKKGIVSGIDMLCVNDQRGLIVTWLGILQKGDPVEILEREGFYTRIRFENVIGYVRSRFIMEV